MMHTGHLVGDDQSHFHSKAMIMYFEASKATKTAASCPFMPKLFLTEALD